MLEGVFAILQACEGLELEALQHATAFLGVDVDDLAHRQQSVESREERTSALAEAFLLFSSRRDEMSSTSTRRLQARIFLVPCSA